MARKTNGKATKAASVATVAPTAPAATAPAAKVAAAPVVKAAPPPVVIPPAKPAPSPFQALAVAARQPAPAPENLALSWQARGDGSAELLLAYEGPLAGRDRVLARAGTWRQGGARWAEVTDVELTRAAPGRYVGAIRVPAAASVEAVELAFRAGDEWDNGGRAPLGFYEWSTKDRRLEVR
jgi:hypothetical protein